MESLEPEICSSQMISAVRMVLNLDCCIRNGSFSFSLFSLFKAIPLCSTFSSLLLVSSLELLTEARHSFFFRPLHLFHVINLILNVLKFSMCSLAMSHDRLPSVYLVVMSAILIFRINSTNCELATTVWIIDTS